MENIKKETHVNIGGNNSGTVNTAEGDIKSTNIINQNDSKDIGELISSLKELINNEKFDSDVKEEVVDDLETIEEQINSGQPKPTRLKKAYQGIKNFVAKIPEGLAHATLIVTQLGELGEKINAYI